MRLSWAGALAGALLLAGTAAHAAPITTLFNTGVGTNGTLLADGTVGDPHYVLTPPLGNTNDILVRSGVGGYPIPPYLGDNGFSRWIGPANGRSLDGTLGLYIYTTTFSLAGLNPATASIVGRWAADDPGVDIVLNGQSLGLTSPSYAVFTSFQITKGFVAGTNTLAFHVRNDGGPTALRVEMNGTADVQDPDPDPTPEPATLAILGAGLAGFALRRRTRA